MGKYFFVLNFTSEFGKTQPAPLYTRKPITGTPDGPCFYPMRHFQGSRMEVFNLREELVKFLHGDPLNLFVNDQKKLNEVQFNATSTKKLFLLNQAINISMKNNMKPVFVIIIHGRDKDDENAYFRYQKQAYVVHFDKLASFLICVTNLFHRNYPKGINIELAMCLSAELKSVPIHLYDFKKYTFTYKKYFRETFAYEFFSHLLSCAQQRNNGKYLCIGMLAPVDRARVGFDFFIPRSFGSTIICTKLNYKGPVIGYTAYRLPRDNEWRIKIFYCSQRKGRRSLLFDSYEEKLALIAHFPHIAGLETEFSQFFDKNSLKDVLTWFLCRDKFSQYALYFKNEQEPIRWPREEECWKPRTGFCKKPFCFYFLSIARVHMTPEKFAEIQANASRTLPPENIVIIGYCLKSRFRSKAVLNFAIQNGYSYAEIHTACSYLSPYFNSIQNQFLVKQQMVTMLLELVKGKGPKRFEIFTNRTVKYF